MQGDYYGEQAARLGYFPSSVVQENQYLKPGKVEVKTSVSAPFCSRGSEAVAPLVGRSDLQGGHACSASLWGTNRNWSWQGLARSLCLATSWHGGIRAGRRIAPLLEIFLLLIRAFERAIQDALCVRVVVA